MKIAVKKQRKIQKPKIWLDQISNRNPPIKALIKPILPSDDSKMFIRMTEIKIKLRVKP